MIDPTTGHPKQEFTLNIDEIAPQPQVAPTPSPVMQETAAWVYPPTPLTTTAPASPPVSALSGIPQINLHPGATLQTPQISVATQQPLVSTLEETHPAQPGPAEESHEPLKNISSSPRINRTKRLLQTIGFGLAGFLLFIVVFNFQLISQQIGYFLHPPKPSQSLNLQGPNAQTTSAAIVPPDNVIIIPKINVSAPIVFADTIADDVVLKDLESGVVHYVNTANPGEKGNSVIFGHSSNDWWEPGNYKFVFALLEKLTLGDQIQINFSSRKYVYQVSEIKVVVPTDVSVLNQTPDPVLTLITCTPPGTSWKRLIVIAKQIEPVPTNINTAPILTDTAQPKIAAKPKPLPGNAPSIGDQVSKFFNGVVSFFSPKQSPKPTQTTPTRSYLPDVS